ncbi:MAG: carbon-nitrogen hydrolase family protein [Chitinophagales bacterium]
MRLALGQLLVEGGEPERNFERAEKMIQQAAEQKADFILLPETIDFAWTHPSSVNEAQTIPGNFSDLFCDLAKKYAIHIGVGLTEKVQTHHFNSAILINEKGEIYGKHHKINLLEVEFPFYKIGQKLEVFDTPFGKIGLNICADNYYDALHIGHTLARMGAQIILSPSSWTVDYHITENDDPYYDKWFKPFHTLASYYDIIVASTTSVGYIVGGPYEGKKMIGCSLVVGKDGVIAQGKKNEFAGDLIIVDIDIPVRNEKGTQIGKMLSQKGYKFD